MKLVAHQMVHMNIIAPSAERQNLTHLKMELVQSVEECVIIQCGMIMQDETCHNCQNCGMSEPHSFMDGVCSVCGYTDSSYGN